MSSLFDQRTWIILASLGSLFSILLLIGGGIMYQREWNRLKRRTDRGKAEG